MPIRDRSRGGARRFLGRALSVITAGYALAALASLALAVVGVNGLFGLEPDPFASIFAMLLAMPWFLLIDFGPAAVPELAAFAMLVLGMAVNLGILLGLRRLMRRGRGVL
ncbi:hypothetical protein DFR52_104410 [Hoeflea marina]|uniref:Uncharacterized protein n=1 Tax=Hoeflea marina TaxID=274592 RepID=A0A317PI61_9HYPH|nr:hypothetical protein [Hoeflea marina]PWV99118.1 hypothetical protein DFR52_104410 [Hoeflea marina]